MLKAELLVIPLGRKLTHVYRLGKICSASLYRCCTLQIVQTKILKVKMLTIRERKEEGTLKTSRGGRAKREMKQNEEKSKTFRKQCKCTKFTSIAPQAFLRDTKNPTLYK